MCLRLLESSIKFQLNMTVLFVVFILRFIITSFLALSLLFRLSSTRFLIKWFLIRKNVAYKVVSYKRRVVLKVSYILGSLVLGCL